MIEIKPIVLNKAAVAANIINGSSENCDSATNSTSKTSQKQAPTSEMPAFPREFLELS